MCAAVAYCLTYSDIPVIQQTKNYNNPTVPWLWLPQIHARN